MGSLGLESVLVGDVVDGVLLSVSSDELVGSADLQGGVLQTDLLQLGGLSAGHTIAGLVPEERYKRDTNQQRAQEVIQGSQSLLSSLNGHLGSELNVHKVVSIDSDVVVLVTEDLGVLGVIQGSGDGEGQDGGEDNQELHGCSVDVVSGTGDL